MKKLIKLLMVLALLVTPLFANGTSETKTQNDSVVTINFPTFCIGVNTMAPWMEERVKTFNKTYVGKYKVEIEEIPGDQNYVNKMKVLYASDSLPDVMYTGGQNLLDMMKDKIVDLTPYVDSQWESTMSEGGIVVNSRDGKLLAIPCPKQEIGYFYNIDLFKKAGIKVPATTWDEFFKQCKQLKAAGITPVSMDTADSGWVTSLMMCAMIASDDAGAKFMNTRLPKNYNTPEFINAANNIQKLFMNYTTINAIGGKYENAASNFYMGQTAIIANGPWMIPSFYDDTMVSPGFAKKVGTAKFPGNTMYNSGEIGFSVCAKSAEKIKASIAFVKFLTSEESQKLMLEKTGNTPDNPNVTSEKSKPLVTEIIRNAISAKHKINDFQSLWYANVVDEISVQYPLLAKGKISGEEFATILSNKAKENL
ncbi:MAG: extracellular solute-binding protein [Spirochaetaceae bacterium]|nr:extracellular solute-binding protein [Spirochaetaceae bacterium]